MKVRCIDKGCCALTNGKAYDVTSEHDSVYYIINDNGDESWYLNSRFEVVPELTREQVEDVARKSIEWYMVNDYEVTGCMSSQSLKTDNFLKHYFNEEPKKMTVSEIAKELGYKVEIVE